VSVKTIFRKGDKVRATCDGRTVTAIVSLASENGRSIIIDWTQTDDHMLTGHVGRMPIFCSYDDNVFRALLDGAVVKLERIET